MRRNSVVFLLLGLLQFRDISARIITSRNYLQFNTNEPVESTGAAEDESQNVMVLRTNIVVNECNDGINCSEEPPPDEDETDENSSESEPSPSDAPLTVDTAAHTSENSPLTSNRDTNTQPSQIEAIPMFRFQPETNVLHNKIHNVHPANTEVINNFINEHTNTVLPFYAGQPLQYVAVDTTPVRPVTSVPTAAPEEAIGNTGGVTDAPHVEDEEDDEEDDDEEDEKEQATAEDVEGMAITTAATPSTTETSRPELPTTMSSTVLTRKTAAVPVTLHYFTSTTTTATTVAALTTTTSIASPEGEKSSAAQKTSPTTTISPTSPTTTIQSTSSTTTIKSTSPTTTIPSTSPKTTIPSTTIIRSTFPTTSVQSTSPTTTIPLTSPTTTIPLTSPITAIPLTSPTTTIPTTSPITTIPPTSPPPPTTTIQSTVRSTPTSDTSSTKPTSPTSVKLTVKPITTLTPPTVPRELEQQLTTTVVKAPKTVKTTTVAPQRRTIATSSPLSLTSSPLSLTSSPLSLTTTLRRRLPTTGTSTIQTLTTVTRIKPHTKVTTLKPIAITTVRRIAYTTTQRTPQTSLIQTIQRKITPSKDRNTNNENMDDDNGISGSFSDIKTSTKVKKICDGCMMKHGVGYLAHPDSCTHFYQCIQGTHPEPAVLVQRVCPLGLYWNQEVLTCDYPSNVQCGKDICSPNTSKSIGGNCRGFLECSGGISVPRCCPARHSFHFRSGLCVQDDACKDVCPTTYTHSFRCDMRSIPGDRFAFEQKTPGNKWLRRKCPILTAFSSDICGCSISAPDNIDLDCKPQLYIPFDNSTDDESGNHVHVRNKGVAVHAGYGHFDGKSHLKITRFSNAWFGETVIVSVRYKLDDPARKERQALVCNGDCDVRPSLYLGVVDDNDTEFFVKTYNSPAVNFTVPSSIHRGWQEVTYVLADGTLEGSVRGVSIAQKAKGAVETRQRALVIGGCDGANGFQGAIDQIAIYLCQPKGR